MADNNTIYTTEDGKQAIRIHTPAATLEAIEKANDQFVTVDVDGVKKQALAVYVLGGFNTGIFEALDYRNVTTENSSFSVYVDAAAASEGDGTAGNPYKTVKYAFSQMKPKNHSGVGIYIKGAHVVDLDEYLRQKDFYFRINFYSNSANTYTAAVESGTFSDGSGYSKKVDSSKSWTVNEHRGKVLKDTVQNKYYTIIENTATALYIRGNTTFTAINMTTYEIVDYTDVLNFNSSDLALKGVEFIRLAFDDLKLINCGEIISDDATVDFNNCSVSCEALKGIGINGSESGFILSSETQAHTVGFVRTCGVAMATTLVFQKSFYDNAVVSYTGAKITKTAFSLNQYATDTKNVTFEFKMADIYIRNYKAVMGIDRSSYFIGGKFIIGGFMDYENVDFIAIGEDGMHIDDDTTFPIYALNESNLNIAPFSTNGTVEAAAYANIARNYNALILAPTGKVNVVSDATVTMKIDIENAKLIVENLNISNIPTSSGGLVSGDVWSDGGTLKIVS